MLTGKKREIGETSNTAKRKKTYEKSYIDLVGDFLKDITDFLIKNKFTIIENINKDNKTISICININGYETCDENINNIGFITGMYDNIEIAKRGDQISTLHEAFDISWLKVKEDYRGIKLGSFLIIYFIYLCKTEFADIKYITLDDVTSEDGISFYISQIDFGIISTDIKNFPDFIKKIKRRIRRMNDEAETTAFLQKREPEIMYQDITHLKSANQNIYYNLGFEYPETKVIMMKYTTVDDKEESIPFTIPSASNMRLEIKDFFSHKLIEKIEGTEKKGIKQKGIREKIIEGINKILGTSGNVPLSGGKKKTSKKRKRENKNKNKRKPNKTISKLKHCKTTHHIKL